jgi:hypothetical protein
MSKSKLHIKTRKCQIIDLAGIRAYAKEKGVSVQELTKEEKARFIIKFNDNN